MTTDPADGRAPRSDTALTVLVVDDHPVFRLGMSALLRTLPGVRVVGEAGTAPDAIAAVDRLAPRVVVMDLDLGPAPGEAPGSRTSGVTATREIRRTRPGTAVLVVTMLGDDDAMLAALRAGAGGYLLKGAEPAEIDRALRAVANGEMHLGPHVAARLSGYLAGADSRLRPPFPELTDREREVVDLVARGLDNAAIARRLVLSTKTVRNYVSAAGLKLGAADRAALVALARDGGLGEPGPDRSAR